MGRSWKRNIAMQFLPAIIEEDTDGFEHYAFARSIIYKLRGPYEEAVRRYVIENGLPESTEVELKENTFTQDWLTFARDNEVCRGIELIVNDSRGEMYVPHTKERVPLGTIEVRNFTRRNWNFHGLVLIEKLMYLDMMVAAELPERYDIAIASGQGYSPEAVRTLINVRLANDDEPITVGVFHDADCAGTNIFNSLKNGSRRRPWPSRVEIIDLGLNPWEAVELGLRPEPPKGSSVADYIHDYDDEHGTCYADTLVNDARWELNFLGSTGDAVRWMEGKIAQHFEKVCPPEKVAKEQFLSEVEGQLKRDVMQELWDRHHGGELVRQRMSHLDLDHDITPIIRDGFLDSPQSHWTATVNEFAEDIVHGNDD